MTPMLPTIGKTIWRPSPATLGQNSAHVMPSACAATAADSRFFLLTLSLTPDGSDTSDTFFALCYPLPLTSVFLLFLSFFSHAMGYNRNKVSEVSESVRVSSLLGGYGVSCRS